MRPFLLLLATGIMAVACTWSARPAEAHGFEAAAGIYTNYSPDFNEFFGASFTASVAYSLPLTPNDVHLFGELGYVYGEGSGAYQGIRFLLPAANGDSTEALSSSFTLWPITVGIRTNLVPSRYRGAVGLYLGLGMVTMLARYDQPLVASSTSPVLGGMLELRPQVRINSWLALWALPRLLFVTDANFGNSVEINFGGSTLQFGVSVGDP